MLIVVGIILAIAALFALAIGGRGWQAWCAAVAILFATWIALGVGSPITFSILLILAVALAVVTGFAPLRRLLFARAMMPVVQQVLPRMGDTERTALEAGTVWWDGEIFSGIPNWKRLAEFECQPLSPREQAFLDEQVDTLCRMLDDWQIEQERGMPEAVWDYLRRERFFGMIIPEQFGGLGFSEIGHSRVVTRIASRSIAAAVTVMVPNSLGPGELLLHYGTEAQKNEYLPRLADGSEIPCFALTGPEAGSDAAATQSHGIVEHGMWQGEQVLGMRLTWNKRYITLAPVATLIGLAFRLKDPHGLLGENEDLGITCALIHSDLPGIEIGDHHDPMGVPFNNGPITGTDVFVPLDSIIGGREQIGHGWRMLMESLAAGRSISLPALAIGAAQMSTRICGAYASVREQFDTPIGRFEGIEEPLARIAGMTYLMSATRTLTCGALDAGERPAVLGSIAKAYLTEGMREVVADAMDIRAGAAIQRGPRNLLSRMWMAVPVGITVEGANILTRSMIIYGQGAIRCHPFVHKLIDAAGKNDTSLMDKAVFGYVNFVATRAMRSFALAVSGSRLAGVPEGDLKRQVQHLSRMSAAFAFVSDLSMMTLGGALKRREKISGRLADALAWQYIAAAVLKRYQDNAKLASHYDLASWSLATALYRAQEALVGVIENLPSRPARILARCVVFPFGARFRPPSDRLGQRVARTILEDREARLDLTADIFVPGPDETGLGTLEAALDKAVRAIPVETKIRDAVRSGVLERAPGYMLDDMALQVGVISEQEYEWMDEAREARNEVVQVDVFDAETYRTLR
ncbi:acyl-CoA dehydrogenase [Oleiagrimonas sp.]|jgi:acyl-CoA dehydrogenase|uniref:acyl-CoA dehydrogenase n=1 Tax=Oleiagrimonas sp. TaxID=2010330 RepID=UPI00260E27C4|nr:acyl-CoA dehydrogenase [Oleiagrimonas sp.]MDA3914009.1 acyl-CoA dehydrogenase [Oleiagrimonas sp.]